MSGGDYWFIYKQVLCIHLNSNAFAASGQPGVDADAAHIGFITNVVSQHGAEAKYTVLVYHHSSYSAGTTPTTPTTRSAVWTSRGRSLDSVWTSCCRVMTTVTRAAM